MRVSPHEGTHCCILLCQLGQAVFPVLQRPPGFHTQEGPHPSAGLDALLRCPDQEMGLKALSSNLSILQLLSNSLQKPDVLSSVSNPI